MGVTNGIFLKQSSRNVNAFSDREVIDLENMTSEPVLILFLIKRTKILHNIVDF